MASAIHKKWNMLGKLSSYDAVPYINLVCVYSTNLECLGVKATMLMDVPRKTREAVNVF